MASRTGGGAREAAPAGEFLAVEQFLGRLSRQLLAVGADDLDAAIEAELPGVGDLAGADRVRLVVTQPETGRLWGAYDWWRPGVQGDTRPLDAALKREFAWSHDRLLRDEVIQAHGAHDLPPEAEAERYDLRHRGVRSMLLIPVRCGERITGGQLFECLHAERVWSDADVTRLRLVGDLFASAIQRAHAELASRASEARFRAFAENALETVAEFDQQGCFQYASPSYRTLLGYEPESLLGTPGDALIHPADAVTARERFVAAFESHGTSSGLHRLRHRDGSWRWFESTGRAYRAADGQTRFFSIGRDVTERRRIEEAMARQLATEEQIAALSRRFLALDAQALDGAVREAIAEAGALAGADRAYLYATEGSWVAMPPRQYEWCGEGVPSFSGARRRWAEAKLRAGEVICTASPDDLPPEAGPERESMLRRRVQSSLAIPVRSGGALVGVIGFETMHAQRRWSEHDIAQLGLVGEILTSAIRRLQAEAALRESEGKLAQAQKLEAVGRLAGGIAHDFNNLLTVILGFSRPLMRELSEQDPVREDVAEIHDAAERAVGLTRQLLTFSRRQSLRESVIDLNGALRGLEPLLRRLLSEDIDLSVSLAGDLDPVRGDPHQFEQVVVNLAVNARDAMPDGGSFEIATRRRSLGDREARRRGVEEGTYVELSVRDSGHGMDEETRAQIFDPFFTTKEPGKGTGLGLSIVYSVVERAGGSIRVEGGRSKGTTFEILLPAVEARVEDADSDDTTRTPGGGSETVLLVEDEPAVRRLARGILAGAGYTVLEAADGEEALAVAAAHAGPLHALVSDVVMPRLGGHALAGRLAATRPTLRTVFISGYPQERGMSSAEPPAGAVLLEKPFSAESLLATLRDVLSAE